MNNISELLDLGIEIKPNVLLKNKTWLGVGGCAEYYADVQDEQALRNILQFTHKNNIPLTVLGAGSNVLIRDGGIKGIVIRLGKFFANIEVQENTLICGSAALLPEIAKTAAYHNLSGFEFMSGIPGTLGGGLKTNAGAYGSDLGHIAVEIVSFDAQGNKHVYNPQQEEIFSYRLCKLSSDQVFVSVKLQGVVEHDNTQILACMQSYKEKRCATQPQGVRTAGSTFKNPPEDSAWKLLDEVGLRGYTDHGAQFSEKHPNFLINTGGASASDLERLIRLAQKKVLEKKGIQLECEIKITGVEKQ